MLLNQFVPISVLSGLPEGALIVGNLYLFIAWQFAGEGFILQISGVLAVGCVQGCFVEGLGGVFGFVEGGWGWFLSVVF